MGVVMQRLLQTIKLDRNAFIWMDYNDRATGDAAILVGVTQILIEIGLGASFFRLLNPITLLNVLIGALFFWLIYTGATYAVQRFLFDGEGSFPTLLRITGFAFPTTILLVFASLVTSSALLTLLIGGVWFVLIVTYGIVYAADLPVLKSALSAVLGYVAIIIVQTIFGNIWSF